MRRLSFFNSVGDRAVWLILSPLWFHSGLRLAKQLVEAARNRTTSTGNGVADTAANG